MSNGKDRISGNLNGNAYAMTVITPMSPWKTIFLRITFWVVALFPSIQQGLIRLSFIHFARWVIIKKDQFPYLGPPQHKEELGYDYLLFCSNFNGTWDQYVDAFSAGIPNGLDRIWNWSVHYPKSIPIRPFKQYITHNQIYTDYYYNAYPGAATNDVKAALRVSDELDLLAEKTAKAGPAEFETAWLEFMTRVDSDLGPTGPGPIRRPLAR